MILVRAAAARSLKNVAWTIETLVVVEIFNSQKTDGMNEEIKETKDEDEDSDAFEPQSLLFKFLYKFFPGPLCYLGKFFLWITKK